MTQRVIIAVDPGNKGGIASYVDGSVMAVRMPTIKRTVGKRKRTAVDPLSVARYFLKLASGTDAMFIMEKVQAMKGQGVSSMFAFGKGAGAVEGVIAMGSQQWMWGFDEVTPQRWKKEVLEGTTKDKLASINYCRRRFPQVNLIPSGCKVPQDGLADALCMLEWGLRKYGKGA